MAAILLHSGVNVAKTGTARRRRGVAHPVRTDARPASVVDQVLEATPDSTVVDLVDRLLNKGVVANGDVTLGVAGIDLIYVRLSALLCAADRVLPASRDEPRQRRKHHAPQRLIRR